MNPFHGIALVLGALGVLIGVVKKLSALGYLRAESSRKAVHMGMGIVCLTFPLIFHEDWPVWSLAGLACLALGSLRVVPGLRRQFGGVLHGVERESLGELYFPLGVAAVFSLAQGRALLFVIPVAVLTFADAVGALVGRRLGAHKFATLEGTKSLEGSLAVGLAGFLCAAGPLLAAGQPLVRTLVTGALIGLFSSLVEAASWRGLDNVFLPLAVFAQVGIYSELSTGALSGRLVALSVIAVAAFAWRRGHFVDESARLGGALAFYFFWATGGWMWLVAPVVLITSYVRFMPAVHGVGERHNLLSVICVTSAALVWAVANAFAPDEAWLWPYTLGIAAQHAVIATVRYSRRWSGRSWLAAWAAGSGQAVVLQGLAFWLVDRGRLVSGGEYAWAGASVLAGCAGFMVWDRHRLQFLDDLNARWWKQGFAALASSLVGLRL